MTTRVLAYAKIDLADAAAFEEAFKETTRMVRGTPGHITDELLLQDDEPGSYIVLSEWETKEQFLAWVDDPIHMEATTAIRPYWAGRVQRKIFDIRVRLSDLD